MKHWSIKRWLSPLIPLTLLFSASMANAQQAYTGGTNLEDVTLDYYLPQEGVTYDPNIPTPQDILGFEVGQWHVRHDQLVRYFEVLAEHSDRVTLKETGRTHEQRPLLLAKISAAKNKDRLDEMREASLALTDPTKNLDPATTPLVVYLGYSVHGDESSGSNAALIMGYYLAAAQGEEVDAWLENSVILLDPSMNPDGLARFAQWANQYRSMTANTDGQHREHIQDWLRGRQNHYWFDLNRDWLLLQHPESEARINTYQRWMPNVLTDHHEMGHNATYFFQPGIPSRKNPLTPDENVTLTEKLAEYHADILDKVHSLYYTEESFDDFYYGKGSSYPDAQGTIAILFEQASSRGHMQETINGVLTFPYTIKNQFLTSISTVRGSHENRLALLDFQKRFFRENIQLARAENFDGYMIREGRDGARMNELLRILRAHSIDAYPVTESFRANNQTYNPGEAYFIPINQRNYRLLKGAFTTRQDFPDNTFYDVSAWTLPMAFNVEFEEVRRTRRFNLGNTPWQEPVSFAGNQLEDTRVGYVFSWEHYFAPRLLAQLQSRGIHTRLAASEMTVTTPSQGEVTFPRGSVIVTRAYQNQSWAEVQASLKALADRNEIPVSTIASGLTPTTGMDIGSRSINPADKPSVMIVIGEGVNLQESGEAWYYLDRHVNLPVTLIETNRLTRVDLSRYTHIVLVDGWYSGLNDQVRNRFNQWVRQGGTLIGQKRGAQWMAENNLLSTKVVSTEELRAPFATEGLSYGDRDHYFGQQRVAGAIFNARVDLSHPLMVGFDREHLPVFKNSTMAFHNNDAPFVDVARYAEQPVLAGFTSEENRATLAGKTAIVAHRLGQGRVIGFADNVNFRAYFWGTSKLLSNAIFWSSSIAASAGEEAESEADAVALEAEHSH